MNYLQSSGSKDHLIGIRNKLFHADFRICIAKEESSRFSGASSLMKREKIKSSNKKIRTMKSNSRGKNIGQSFLHHTQLKESKAVNDRGDDVGMSSSRRATNSATDGTQSTIAEVNQLLSKPRILPLSRSRPADIEKPSRLQWELIWVAAHCFSLPTTTAR
ncbi:hypothetical protein CEXT_313111 [Caerostris extrusa]|uniref:Uncharacterized protein n=1 Tax=Caerostris extrusa TaxID=172846 RepID=A0AAV4MAH1_CAEEX|nr:hypothetical protein CEXT_313111 [Caerostris extrusa]